VLQLVLRLSRGGVQELLTLLFGQMFTKHEQTGQVNLATLDHAQRDRESAHYPGRGDAPVRFIVTHAKPPETKLVQGAARGLQIESTRFDFTEVREEPGEHLAPLSRQRVNAYEQFVVGQICEDHFRFLPSTFSRSGVARWSVPRGLGRRESPSRATMRVCGRYGVPRRL
jgi:hypothetical protein